MKTTVTEMISILTMTEAFPYWNGKNEAKILDDDKWIQRIKIQD